VDLCLNGRREVPRFGSAAPLGVHLADTIVCGQATLRRSLYWPAARKPGALPEGESDSITYLAGIARGKFKSSGLNSLENNVIVVEILQAARDSVRTGRKVTVAAQ